jgi:peptidyl-prolyl cis-trans isomerase A (cyclophilin A)
MRRIGSTGRRQASSPAKPAAAAAGAVAGAVVQRLESRQLLTVTTTAIPPVLAHPSAASQDQLDLSSFLTDSALPPASTIATFTFGADNSSLFGKTRRAQVQVALTDEATPITVANFLRYVNGGLYNGTFLHRAVDIASGANGSPSDPATIDQGGGYYIDKSNPARPKLQLIQTFPPIVNDEAGATLTNSAGTIATANTGAANSASSQWYFNVSDNTSLDGSYTAFGEIIGNGLATLTTISELPTAALNTALTSVPVTGISEARATAAHPQIGPANLVYLDSVTSEPSITYTAASSDPSLVSPVISGHTLGFSYGGSGGTAVITVNAAEYDGSTASESFTVTVPPATASSTSGPVVAPSTASAISNGSATTLFPLANDTDSASALNPATVSIVTAPAHGVATVDTTTGEILYTPTTSYTGADTISYTVADEAGTVSSATTITINLITPPATVTIGAQGRDTLVLTQPNGAVSQLTISGGTATITFAGSDVDQSTGTGVAIASGTDATIASIDINNARHHRASLSVSGGAVTLSDLTDAGIMSAIAGPAATLTGTLNVQGLAELNVAATDDALLQIGSGAGATALIIPTATDTSVQAGGVISTLRSAKWISDTGGAFAIAAQGIRSLQITGEFDDGLDLSGVAGDTIITARIGGALGSSSGAPAAATWTVGGAIGQLSAASVNADWSLQAAGAVGAIKLNGDVSSALNAANILNLTITGADNAPINSSGDIQKLSVGGADSGGVTTAGALQTVTVHGDLTGAISAGTTLGTLNVTGNISGSTIATHGVFSATAIQLNQIKVGGAITNEVISSVGNMGTLTAASLTGSAIYAGVVAADVTTPVVPTTTSDFVTDVTARIKAVRLSNGTSTAFSNSKIAAETLGELSLGVINTSNGGVAEGLSGETLTAVNATLSNGPVLKLRHSQLTNQTALLAYLASKSITMDDFVINVIAASS